MSQSHDSRWPSGGNLERNWPVSFIWCNRGANCVVRVDKHQDQGPHRPIYQNCQFSRCASSRMDGRRAASFPGNLSYRLCHLRRPLGDARRHEYTVAFTVSPCVEKGSSPGAIGYYDGVFWEKQRITSFQPPTTDYLAALKGGTVTYQVYVRIPAQATPGTFCLQLSGGTMGGATISSNAVPLNP